MANNTDDQPPLFEQPEVPNGGPPRYTLSDGQAISSQRLNSSDREVQLDVMRRWFYEN